MNKYTTDLKKEQEKNPSLAEHISKFNERKRLSIAISELYKAIPDYKIARLGYAMRGCCDSMIIRKYETAETESVYTLYCGLRLCPQCAHRRSLKAFAQLSQILDEADRLRTAQSGKPYEYILLTLTMQSIGIEAFEEAIIRLSESVTKLTRTKAWKDAIKGAWRSLEITFNAKTMQYHPHVHLLCAVNPSYFSSKAYISQDKLRQLWKRCGKFPYEPIVDIRRIKTELEKGVSISGAKAEVSKYVTKHSDFLLNMPSVDAQVHLAELTFALQGKKQYICYGIIRQIQRLLNLSDEDGDLNDIVEEDSEVEKLMRPDVKYVYDMVTYDPYIGAYLPTRIYDEDNNKVDYITGSLLPPPGYMVDKFLRMENDRIRHELSEMENDSEES